MGPSDKFNWFLYILTILEIIPINWRCVLIFLCSWLLLYFLLSVLFCVIFVLYWCQLYDFPLCLQINISSNNPRTTLSAIVMTNLTLILTVLRTNLNTTRKLEILLSLCISFLDVDGNFTFSMLSPFELNFVLSKMILRICIQLQVFGILQYRES